MSSTPCSSSRDCEEQSAGSAETQCSVMQKLETYLEAIQSLIKYHGEQERSMELWSKICDNNECGNSDRLSTIAGYVENIQKVITEAKQNSEPAQAVGPADDPPDPCQTALNNSVILRTIMKNLDAPDVLGLRLVAKQWDEEASIHLSSNPRFNERYNKVMFGWDEEQLRFQGVAGTLEEFTEKFCSNPLRKFPCSQFFFVILSAFVNDKVPADLANFLSKNGQNIKSLGLVIFGYSPTVFKFIKSILGSTPNLQFLGLDIPRIESQGPEDLPKLEDVPELSVVSLEDLKELWFFPSFWFDMFPKDFVESMACTRLVTDILSAAPNLKRIFDQCLWFTKEIISGGKIHTIQKLKLGRYLKYPKNMDLFVQLSRACPQLMHLEINPGCLPSEYFMPDKTFLCGLQQVFESSKKTLKTCYVHGRLDLVIDNCALNIPTMEKLEDICLDGWCSFENGSGRVLPPGFSIQNSFPRLKNLRFSGISDENEDAHQTDNPFDVDSNSSTTVENLSITPQKEFLPKWLRQARVLYPNVRILNLEIRNNQFELPGVFNSIWRFWEGSLLEELHIEILILCYFKLNPDLVALMDQALTGFDLETCRMLRKQRDFGSSPRENEFQRGPSILNMRRLKLFRVNGSFWSRVPIFSRVSVIHGFEPLAKRQNLRVLYNDIELNEMCLDCGKEATHQQCSLDG